MPDRFRADELGMRAISKTDGSLNVQVFLYLQMLDVITSWLGFRVGLSEASPFVRLLISFGPMAGLLATKLIALVLGGFCVWSGRFQVIRLINYWYAALVVWNLALILSR
jgi:hypothetical protein